MALEILVVGQQGCAWLWKPGCLCAEWWLMVVILLKIFHRRLIHGIRSHGKQMDYELARFVPALIEKAVPKFA